MIVPSNYFSNTVNSLGPFSLHLIGQEPFYFQQFLQHKIEQVLHKTGVFAIAKQILQDTDSKRLVSIKYKY